MDKYGSHLTWFCVDSSSRKHMIIKSLQEPQNTTKSKQQHQQELCENSSDLRKMVENVFAERNMISFLSKLLSIAHVEFSSDDSLKHSDKQGEKRSSFSYRNKYFNIVEALLVKSGEYKTLLEEIFDYCRKAPKEKIIKLFEKFNEVTNDHLFKVQNELEGGDDDDSVISKKMMKISSFFDQSIILINRVTDDFEWDLREWLVGQLYVIFCDEQFQQGDKEIPFSSAVLFGNSKRTGSFISSLRTVPRRSLASAIVNPNIDSSKADRFILDTKVAFSTFDSRLIAIEEWFKRFHEHCTIDEQVAKTDLVHRFAFCVYQFMLCGLITRSRHNETVFEKTALVWATV